MDTEHPREPTGLLEPEPEPEPTVDDSSRARGQSIILDLDETLVYVAPGGHQCDRSPDYVFDSDNPMAGSAVWLRPHAREFVDYCFRRFENVALWTHATPGYRPMIEALFPDHAASWAFDGCACKAYTGPFGGSGDHYDKVQRRCPHAQHSVAPGRNFVWFSGRKTRRSVCSNCGRTAVQCQRTGCSTMGRGAASMSWAGNEPFTAVHLKRLRKVWNGRGRKAAGWTQARTLIVDDTPGNCLDNYGNAITVSSWGVFDDLPGQEGDDNPAWQDKELAELMLYLDSAEVQQCPELYKLDKSDWRRRVLKSKPKLETELEPSESDPCRPMLTQKQETRDLSLKLELKLPSGCFNPAHKCFAFVVKGVLTPAECAEWIDKSERRGYVAATIKGDGGQQKDTSIRNSGRNMHDSNADAGLVYERLRPHLPEFVRSRRCTGLNPRLRFLRYDSGEYFGPHFDGEYRHPNGQQTSLLTCMLYLNSGGGVDYADGETRFLPTARERPSEYFSRMAKGTRYAPGQDCGLKVVPETGDCLIFSHETSHEGREVTRGRKYAVRTDVVYETVPSE